MKVRLFFVSNSSSQDYFIRYGDEEEENREVYVDPPETEDEKIQLVFKLRECRNENQELLIEEKIPNPNVIGERYITTPAVEWLEENDPDFCEEYSLLIYGK